jgi:limonene-1,2-epoxide hydrolase
MSATDTVTQDALAVARRFIDAFNDRDADALSELVTDDVELRKYSGEALHGRERVRALLDAAEDLDLRLFPFRPGSVEARDGAVEARLPVREVIGTADIERVAVFEIRDGRVATFAVRSLE